MPEERAPRGPVRRRSLDPLGKRALFESPVGAARDTIRSGSPSEGKDALYSTGPRRNGTVVVSCAGCDARSRINLTDLGMRLATVSVWLPIRKHSHWMRCPSCGRRTWCQIGWQD
ncbi:MAG: hypothetical protein JWN46_3584 [Acidimicrobiales bacterium]|nr:hypothetical protein [Acidimicrobiales bacterium]